MRDAPAPDPIRTATVQLSGVTVEAEGKAILRDVSFCASEARIGIVGRNGSGKTTLARVIAGLITPQQGRAEIAGVDMARDRKAALRLAGILFQNPDHQIIFPTVEEEIGFGLRQLGQTKTEAADGTAAMLARFGKSHWAKAAVHRLSQGQKQLVCLMAVLAMQPRVIVLDEPFSGLDIPTRLQLQRHFGRAGVQLIHISHDPHHLAGYGRILWIEDGRIAADGPPGQVLPDFTRQMTDWGAADDLSDLAG
ncbi:energy-coupling factor ABC transporter ATP-binding protein [Roseobacteraceae bacterium NS-SX3]